MPNESVGRIALDLVLNSKGFTKQLGTVQSKADSVSGRISNSFSKIGVAAAAAFSTAAILKFSKTAINAANLQTEAETKLETVMRQRMHATDKNIQKIKNYTSEQQKLGVVGDEVQMSGAQQLATFLKTEKSLKTLIPAMNNLAVQQNGVNVTSESMRNIGNLMGKVMQGQTAALTRVGITFDGAQEKMLKYGNEEQRAATLAQVITDNVGQMNAAIAATPAGKFQQIKNSFGDMSETMGRALINVFSPLLSVLNKATAKLQEFATRFEGITKSIFGDSNAGNAINSSISSAAESTSDLSDSADSSASNLNKTAKAAKKVKGALAGFDKLNVLSSAKKSADNAAAAANGAAGGAVGGLAKGINIPVNVKVKGMTAAQKAVKKFAEQFKGAFKAVGKSFSDVWKSGEGPRTLNNLKGLALDILGIVGDIAGAFKKAWEENNLGNKVVKSIFNRFNSLVGLVRTFTKTFRNAWNSGHGERIWKNILEMVKNANNYVATLRKRVALAWKQSGAGEKIWGNILGFIGDIFDHFKKLNKIKLNWAKTLDFAPLANATEKLTGAFRELFKACSGLVRKAYKEVLLPLAKWAIEEVVPKVVEMLAGALKALSNAVRSINSRTLHALAAGIAAIGTAILVFKAGQKIADGIAKIRKAISALTAHPVVLAISAATAAIAGITAAVQTYETLKWNNSAAKRFADSCQKVRLQIEENTQGITDNLKGTLENIDSVFKDNTLADEYQSKLEELLKKAELSPQEQSQLKTIVSYFKDNVPGFNDVWNRYVKISDDGKIKLNGHVDEVMGKLDNLIDKYQKAASMSALSDMTTENRKAQIQANKDLQSSGEKLLKKEKQVEDLRKKYAEWRKKNNIKVSDETILLYEKDSALYKTGYELLTQIKSSEKSVNKLKKAYNGNIDAVNKLVMTGDDLSDVVNVLNGDYSDAAAVMMAYNSGMINMKNVQESEWKTLDNLETKARESGKNTILGYVEGTNQYKDALIKNSNGLASRVVSEWDEVAEKQVPEVGEKYTRNLYAKLTDKGWFEKLKTAGLNAGSTYLSEFLSGIRSAGDIEIAVGKKQGALQPLSAAQIGKIASRWTGKKFANGGVVKAPTIAMVGDNRNAHRDPEIISPQSAIQKALAGAQSQPSGKTDRLLEQLIGILNEFFTEYSNTDHSVVISEKEIFNATRNQNTKYKNAHGRSALV